MSLIKLLSCAIIFTGVALVYKTNAHGFEIAGGIAAVDEMDDRLRPAASMHIGFTDEYYMRALLYGRKFGPIIERTSILSFAYRFPVYSNKSNLTAGVGLSTLLEETTYDPNWDQETGEDKDKKNQFNMGMNFGIGYRMPIDPIYLSFDWDGHVYLAGVSGLLLATGRKQALNIGIGLRF